MRFSRKKFNEWLASDKGNACWLWPGAKDTRGYGCVYHKEAKSRLAHRYVYELLISPIDSGLEIDHLCRNHACVNPKHLEAVSHKINVQRGLAGSQYSNRQHCANGHLFIPSNTRMEGTKRRCRECIRNRSLKYYHEKGKAKRQAQRSLV